jgi:hypothetical protein
MAVLPSVPKCRASAFRLQSWACGAAGSARPWHGRGRRFDPDQVHQISAVHARCQSRFHSLLLLLYALSATGSSQRQYVLGDPPSSRNICREEPVFAGKVTCGVRNETSGQSWPSNTVATDPFTGQNRIQNVAAVSSTNVWAVGGQRLCTFRFKRFVYIGMAARGVLSSLPFSPINLDKGPLQP